MSLSVLSFQLRKHQRIKTPAEFKRVYANKQWGNTRLLTFNVMATDKQTQLGVTVSKKVSKLAVRRNRLKRLVKEFFRVHQHQLKSAKLVITVKPAAATADNQEIQKELHVLWEKLLKWQRWHQHQIKSQTDT